MTGEYSGYFQGLTTATGTGFTLAPASKPECSEARRSRTSSSTRSRVISDSI